MGSCAPAAQTLDSRSPSLSYVSSRAIPLRFPCRMAWVSLPSARRRRWHSAEWLTCSSAPIRASGMPSSRLRPINSASAAVRTKSGWPRASRPAGSPIEVAAARRPCGVGVGECLSGAPRCPAEPEGRRDLVQVVEVQPAYGGQKPGPAPGPADPRGHPARQPTGLRPQGAGLHGDKAPIRGDRRAASLKERTTPGREACSCQIRAQIPASHPASAGQKRHTSGLEKRYGRPRPVTRRLQDLRGAGR